MKLPVAHIIAVILILICLPLLMGADFMYWESDFGPIVLPNLTTREGESEGEAEVNLFTTGDVEISADNTDTARLTKSGGGSLYTAYKLKFDGDGVSETGGSTVSFTSYDSFLITPVYVTYVPDDNDVKVTLSVNAKNYNDQLADAGIYTATQTLTVSWVGP